MHPSKIPHFFELQTTRSYAATKSIKKSFPSHIKEKATRKRFRRLKVKIKNNVNENFLMAKAARGKGIALLLTLPLFQTANYPLLCCDKLNKNVLSIKHKGESHTNTLWGVKSKKQSFFWAALGNLHPPSCEKNDVHKLSAETSCTLAAILALNKPLSESNKMRRHARAAAFQCGP